LRVEGRHVFVASIGKSPRNNMNFKSIIIRLYFMLIHSDGKVNEGEISLGKKMIEAENISETEFNFQTNALKSKDIAQVYKECITDLKRLKSEQQIRSIAWMCVLANSDGFMDKAEWQFIYKVYHKELQLPLEVIMDVQKELIKKINSLPTTNPSIFPPSRSFTIS
jgi:uncharacterized tellurite resistance protein B-like protein